MTTNEYELGKIVPETERKMHDNFDGGFGTSTPPRTSDLAMNEKP